MITKHVQKAKKAEIHSFVLTSVTKGATLVTDESPLYVGLKGTYVRKEVKHSLKEYVDKDGYTTNPIEGYWSLLKRGVYGIYHQISAKHTQRYLDEFSFRFNSREEENQERFDNALKQSDRRLTYNNLISNV